MQIALMGTRGVPARYGGFETCVEEVGRRLATFGHDVLVYCREPGPADYLGMHRVEVAAIRRRALETLSSTALAVADVVRRRPDVAVVFNSANAPLLPALRARRIPVATHVDGLEWRRAKWSGAGQRYYRRAEALAVRWSDALIADARGIQDYYRYEFGVGSEQIAYGAPILGRVGTDLIGELGLEPAGFHLVVARFEPENHVDLMVAGYRRSTAQRPFIVVGGVPYGDAYTDRIRAAAGEDPRIRLIGPVWDQTLLDQLYANAYTYLHGHSVGGTNPSLLRAIGAGTATLAYDVVFNHEVLRDAGGFFRTEQDVAALVERAEDDPEDVARRGQRSRQEAARYDWNDVAKRYEQLCERLAAGRSQKGQASGRRRRAPAASSRVGQRPLGTGNARADQPHRPTEEVPRGN
jgi:glycosyltransferase involved in cell wall biosynthesis